MNFESQEICLNSNSFVFMWYHLCPWKYLFYCADIIFEIWTVALWGARWDLEGDKSSRETWQTLLTLQSCRKVLEGFRDLWFIYNFYVVYLWFKQNWTTFPVLKWGVWEGLTPEGSVVLVLVESDWLELNVAEYSSNHLPSFPDILYGIYGYVIYCISCGNAKDLIWHIIIPNIPKKESQ